MIEDIRSDVAAFATQPQHVSWFKSLEDKLRRVYSVLTCAGGTDVAPRGPAPRPTRHSSATQDAQVSPSRHSVGRQDPRPRLTRAQTPRPQPTYESGSSSQQPDPSQPLMYRPPDASQPGSSTWQAPPTYQQPMYQQPPVYQQPPMHHLGMPTSGYGIQPHPHMLWNPSPVPMTQFQSHLGK